MGDEGNYDQEHSKNKRSYGEFFRDVFHFCLERRLFGDLFLGKIRYPSEFGIHSGGEYHSPGITGCDGRSHPHAVVPFGE